MTVARLLSPNAWKANARRGYDRPPLADRTARGGAVERWQPSAASWQAGYQGNAMPGERPAVSLTHGRPDAWRGAFAERMDGRTLGPFAVRRPRTERLDLAGALCRAESRPRVLDGRRRVISHRALRDRPTCSAGRSIAHRSATPLAKRRMPQHARQQATPEPSRLVPGSPMCRV